jgi:hypothetical protein
MAVSFIGGGNWSTRRKPSISNSKFDTYSELSHTYRKNINRDAIVILSRKGF